MTINQRQFRSPDSHIKQVIDRLYRETGATSFARICDTISIPRDLRSGLLDQLVEAGYVTGEANQVQSKAKEVVLSREPVMSPPVEETRNPSPHDSESRARTPGTGRRR